MTTTATEPAAADVAEAVCNIPGQGVSVYNVFRPHSNPSSRSPWNSTALKSSSVSA